MFCARHVFVVKYSRQLQCLKLLCEYFDQQGFLSTMHNGKQFGIHTFYDFKETNFVDFGYKYHILNDNVKLKLFNQMRRCSETRKNEMLP